MFAKRSTIRKIPARSQPQCCGTCSYWTPAWNVTGDKNDDRFACEKHQVVFTSDDLTTMVCNAYRREQHESFDVELYEQLVRETGKE